MMAIFLLLLISTFFLSVYLDFYLILFFSFLSFMSFYPLYFDHSLFIFSLDTLSFFLIYLSFWVMSLMISSSSTVFKTSLNPILFMLILSFLLLSLLGSFLVSDIFWFYFFFEFSLIPTGILIMGWGYQVERLQAFSYFMMYTLSVSLPFLLFIFYARFHSGCLTFSDLTIFFSSFTIMLGGGGSLWFINLLMFMVFGAFLVKTPIYLFHLWLPKAHVEAPVSGSMILAGVLLKLGGYGIIRFCSMIFYVFYCSFIWVISLSLIGMFYIGMSCIRSNDMKSLIAYSSVSHMALGLVGIMTCFHTGLLGGVYMLLGHGVCSSGLFCYINMIYERSGSRSLSINKSMMSMGISMVVLCFFLSIMNMAAPPSISLFSEIFLFLSVNLYSFMGIPLITLGSFLVAIYSIFFFSFSHQGKFNSFFLSFSPININEYFNLLSHITPLFISFVFLGLI